METACITPRQKLIGLSASVKVLVESGQFDSVNDALIALYLSRHPEASFFRTFNEWKKEGKKVRKGEKGFLVWGRKLKRQLKDQEGDGVESEGARLSKFFPLAYVFADTQVD